VILCYIIIILVQKAKDDLSFTWTPDGATVAFNFYPRYILKDT
jgi:hypothetical protein